MSTLVTENYLDVFLFSKHSKGANWIEIAYRRIQKWISFVACRIWRDEVYWRERGEEEEAPNHTLMLLEPERGEKARRHNRVAASELLLEPEMGRRPLTTSN